MNEHVQEFRRAWSWNGFELRFWGLFVLSPLFVIASLIGAVTPDKGEGTGGSVGIALFGAVVFGAGNVVLDRRVRRRRAALGAVCSPAFSEMVHELGLGPSTGAIGVDPKSLLSWTDRDQHPVCIKALEGAFAGRSVEVAAFITTKGDLSVTSMALTRTAASHERSSIGPIPSLRGPGAPVKKVSLGGKGKELFDQEFRDWYASTISGVSFSVDGTLVSATASGHLNASNIRPLLVALTRFADRLED